MLFMQTVPILRNTTKLGSSLGIQCLILRRNNKEIFKKVKMLFGVFLVVYNIHKNPHMFLEHQMTLLIMQYIK